MGLDMYLTGEKYIYGEDFEKNKKKIKKMFPTIDLEPESIIFSIFYWRKANHIHRWFVENVQGGEDDCGKYYVSIENLKELLKLIEEILKDRTKANELLPTKSGFFFGGEEYDEYYFNDLIKTKNMIKNVIDTKFIEAVSIHYRSSW